MSFDFPFVRLFGWVLTFPLLDCSEFDNFVITLIWYSRRPVRRSISTTLAGESFFAFTTGFTSKICCSFSLADSSSNLIPNLNQLPLSRRCSETANKIKVAYRNIHSTEQTNQNVQKRDRSKMFIMCKRGRKHRTLCFKLLKHFRSMCLIAMNQLALSLFFLSVVGV
jgi:hypothetical protein